MTRDEMLKAKNDVAFIETALERVETLETAVKYAKNWREREVEVNVVAQCFYTSARDGVKVELKQEQLIAPLQELLREARQELKALGYVGVETEDVENDS